MPILSRQNLVIPLGGGLDTEIADKLLPQGKLLELENAVINQTGKISKRPGKTALRAPIGVTWQLATRRDTLIQLGQDIAAPIEIYTASGNRWLQSNVLSAQSFPVGVRRTPVYSSAGQRPEGGDIAYVVNANVYVISLDTSSLGGSTYTRRTLVQDATNGQIIYQTTATGSAPTDPRVLQVGNFACIVYHDGAGNLKADVFSAANLSGGGSPTTYTLTALAHASLPHADIRVGTTAGTIEVAYRSAANTLRRVILTVANGVTADAEILTAASASINPSLQIAWIQDFNSTGKAAVATAGPAGVQVQWDVATGTAVGTYVLDATATGDVRGLTGHTISSASGGDFVVLWDIYTIPLIESDTWFGKRTVSGGIATPVAFIRGLVLESKTFLRAGGVFVMLGCMSDTQPTHFMFGVSSTHNTSAIRAPLAKAMVTEALAGTGSRGILTSVVNAPTPSMVMVLRKQGKIEAIGSVHFTDTGVDQVALDFSGENLPAVDAGDTLFVPGGQLLAFDGTTYAEYGHPLYPEGLTVGTETGGGGLGSGTYSWCWVYRYTDANERVVRSQPSPIAQFATTGAGKQVLVRGPYARMHGRFAASDIVIEQYRTTVNGELFFLETTFANDITGTFVNRASNLSDVDLQAGEPLYTTGDVLANEPTPPTRIVAHFRDRVWMVSADNPDEIWASSTDTPGVGHTFSSVTSYRRQDSHGGFTALMGYGLNMFVFKKTAIYALNGAGPNALGQGDFGDFQEISSGRGAIDARSVVATPIGIFFKSDAGIYITNGGVPEYIGAPVARYNDLDIVAAVAFPKMNQVRFYTGGVTLVYDWFHQQWITHLSHDAVGGGSVFAATNWLGREVISFNTNLGLIALIESAPGEGEVWTDNDVPFSLAITTPWISVGGLQGVQRVYQIEGVGDVVDSHTLRLSIQYDNNQGPLQLYEKDFVLGDDWEWRLKPQRQISTAIKVRLIDSSPADGGAFSVVALVFNVGVEPAHLKRLLATAKSLLP